MTFNSLVSKIASFVSAAVLMVGLLPGLMQPTVSAQSTPPTEPNCQTTSATPVWNPRPLVLNLPNPQISTQPCQDMPLLSHFPVQTDRDNPREKTITSNQNVGFHLYYVNGANPGSPSIQNPTAKVQVVKESETRWRISASLEGGNAATVTSQQKGGDLILNVPAGTELSILGQNTLHYPDAIERKAAVDNGEISSPFNRIPDNSANGTVSNPLYTQFSGTNLPSSNGFRIKDNGLEAGYLGYGYILSQLSVKVPEEQPQPANNPPALPGQEITVIRGQSGSFQPLNGTDPDGDLPLTYEPQNLPNFCTYNASTRVISCQTNAQTPVRTTFTVVPIDSKGLRGTPGTFIVNVIEPGLNIQKSCAAKGTTTPCAQAGLKPGDQVTYTINVSNSGNAPATNVVVNDNYDESKLEGITNIQPEGTLDTAQGTIRWNLGTLNAEQSRSMTYDATIRNSAASGSVIENLATVQADGIPPKESKTQFTLGSNQPLLSTSDKICYKKGTTTPCNRANLTLGDQVSYIINVRNTGNAPAENVRVTDTYDRSRLVNVGNITPQGTLDTNAGTIVWNLGRVAAGESRALSFEATIAATVTNGSVIVNTARITADGLPDQVVRVEFPVGIPVAPQTPRSGGVAFFLSALGLLSLGAGVYYYRKNNKLAKGFVPSRAAEIDPTTGKAKKITKKK